MLNKRYLPSITALQCFEAVTRHLSFTRAAERLGLTASALSKAIDRLEKRLGFLATVGAASPFIGLFGTVWGIMNAFRGLSNVGSATLAHVAPGIAEALVATAIGLFSAIPAVIAYNRFARDIDRVATHQETFIEEFSNILQRNLGAQPASTGHTASGH